jgi:hypothetical protein
MSSAIAIAVTKPGSGSVWPTRRGRASSQLPRAVALGGARRSEPELALLLQSPDPKWHSVTSWLSVGEGGHGGSALVLVERITATEIEAYVEQHVESPGSSSTESYVMGKVVFRRCF